MQRYARNVVSLLVMLLTMTTALFVGTSAAHAESDVMVYSPSMGRDVHVTILGAGGGGPKPSLILLDGLRATEWENGWLANTNVRGFFADKNVNVAIPWGGGGSFYTDWERDDPKLGRQKWETFLTAELPAYMEASLGSAPGRYAVAGLSMSGGQALNLAAHRPDMFRAAASFSGYPTPSTPGFAQGIMAAIMEMGANPLNMWGFWPNLKWYANDPMIRVGAFRGMGVYISSGYGAGSTLDATANPFKTKAFDAVGFVQKVPLETAAGLSTTEFLPALLASGARVQTNISGSGVHTWPHWEARLIEAWYGTIAPSIGA